MPIANLEPNQRYAIVGKTGSGKTSLGMVLAGTFAQSLPSPWEVWWIDTKNDTDDLRALRKWGFRNGASKKDRTQAGGLPNAVYWLIRPIDGEDDSVMRQAQDRIKDAYNRHHVLLVIDEYAQITPSKTSAGQSLLNVFQRGRGLDVGIIGLTQEPVFIPRQLLSQASHLVLFNLTYDLDIEYIKKFYKGYIPPGKKGDPYGFYWAWIDGNGEWTYYRNQAEWYEDLMVRLPKVPAQTA